MGKNPAQTDFSLEKEAGERLHLVSDGAEAEAQEGRLWVPPNEVELSFLTEPPSCRPRMWGPVNLPGGAPLLPALYRARPAPLPPLGQSELC